MTDYRVLVTGPRDMPSPAPVWSALNDAQHEALTTGRRLVVIHGSCRSGADHHAHTWLMTANQFVKSIDEESYPAEDFGSWPQCGPIRNAHMVNLGADHCDAFMAPCTRRRCRRPQPHNTHGTSDCANRAEAAGIPIRRITIKEQP
ncbi:SLOG family protein [Streptomyces smyrnaeus]|uniref:SLOG family protein n=1 Tax=Streptomyces smyrnaeus TaxID=1387713 RepID=UPI0033C56F55